MYQLLRQSPAISSIILSIILNSSFSTSVMAANKKVKELDAVIAVVNNDVITRTELKKRIQQVLARLQAKKTPLPPKNVLYRQILEKLIEEQIQLQLAKRASVIIDDESVNAVIQRIARENKMELDEFKNVLERDGLNYKDFRTSIKNEMTITQLRKRRVENRVTVSEQEVDTELRNQKNNKALSEEYQLQHILIATPESASPEQIQTAQTKANQILAQLSIGADFSETAAANSNGQNALNGGDLGWRETAQLPTVFVEQIIKLDAGQLTDIIRSPSGFHIVKVVAKRSKDKRRIISQTKARHILMTPNQIKNNAIIKSNLSRLRERILKGEDFATIAKANSEDKGTARKGGDLGWVSPGQMVPEFQEAMSKLGINDISQPVQSRFGWHLIQVLGQRQHDDTETYERNKIRKQIGERKIEEAVNDWLRRLRGEAYVEYRINK